jgi:cell division control protein 11
MGATFPHDGNKRGRKYPWGFLDVDDSKVCDLRALETILLKYPLHFDTNQYSTARDDLRDYTHESLYERYRSEKLLSLKN